MLLESGIRHFSQIVMDYIASIAIKVFVLKKVDVYQSFGKNFNQPENWFHNFFGLIVLTKLEIMAIFSAMLMANQTNFRNSK